MSSENEVITTKEQYYDLSNYKDEVAQYVVKKRADLDKFSNSEALYNQLYKVVFAGSEQAKDIRFPHAAEMYKVYKSAIIEACLSGYSALEEIEGMDAYSILKAPELKKVRIGQYRQMALLEKLSAETLDDWTLKGEAVAFIKLKENKEEYRVKQTLEDAETGQPVLKFTMKEFVSYDTLAVERIDPYDFYVDAYDYEDDPKGCTKIVRSWISPKQLLTSNQYPLLTQEDKKALINSVGRNSTGYLSTMWGNDVANYDADKSKTAAKKIEVLTFYGDYITSDYKVLKNIKATVIGNRMGNIKYSDLSTNRIIYAPYKIDDNTHRAISPLACTRNVDDLINRVTDLFIQNLDDRGNPIMMYQKGSMTRQQVRNAKTERELEYTDIGGAAKPDYIAPPEISPQGLSLMEMILGQNKNVLGLNQYLAGSTDGAVRTAKESSILFMKANARMRVETDVFSYRFLLPLFTAFYAFNRELALVLNRPLAEIYTDPNLKVMISTNASKADKEGELQRLMQMLNLPIAQMIFSNLTPDQVVLAVRYLMAKADLTDADNLLELVDSEGNTQFPDAPPPNAGTGKSSDNFEMNKENGGIPPSLPANQSGM